MNVVEMTDVSYSRPGMNHALKNISFTISQGDLVHLKGKSGSGKSTLLDFILGLRTPDSGSVKVFGNTPGTLEARFRTGVSLQKVDSPTDQAEYERSMSMIENHYPGGNGRVKEILGQFNFEFSSGKTEFAGGEQRAISIAITQIGFPEFLILDEPTESLDQERKRILFSLLRDLKQQGTTILLISHEKESDIVRELQPSKIYLLKDGHMSLEYSDNSLRVASQGNRQLSSYDKVSPLHWLKLSSKYVRFNVAQTFRNDKSYLLISLLSSIFFTIMVAFTSNNSFYAIVNACSFYLSVVAMTNTGNLIAIERRNKFLTNTLKILPLPPLLYLSAKVVSSLIINLLLISTIVFAAATFNGISLFLSHTTPDIAPSLMDSFSAWSPLLFSFAVATIPFSFFGLMLGYFLGPKSIQQVAILSALALSLPIYARPLLSSLESLKETWNFDFAKLIGDYLAAHSVAYHSTQLSVCMGNLPECDQYIGLHLMWWVWFTGIAVILGLWAYYRVSKKAAKA